ncbi:porin family protein [Psychroserpens sp. BH13MA-6]
MKNNISLVFTIFMGLLIGHSQEATDNSSEMTFGAKAGFSSTVLRINVDNITVSEDVSGFYVGVFGDLSISEAFGIHSELLYGSYSQDGESTDILFLPILAQFHVNDRFHLMAGPQFDYLLDAEASEGLKRLGIGIGLGAAFDITEQLILDARYSFGLINRLNGDIAELNDTNVQAKFNYLFIGLGYRF